MPTACELLHHFLRVTFALLFVFAGIAKLVDIGEFARNLGDFGVVHDSLVVPTAWTISLMELVTGLALVFNIRGSLTVLLILLTLFIGVLVYGIGLGLDIDCGCLGPSYHVGLRTQLIVDLGLIVWCGLVHCTGKKCGARPARLVAVVSGLVCHQRKSA